MKEFIYTEKELEDLLGRTVIETSLKMLEKDIKDLHAKLLIGHVLSEDEKLTDLEITVSYGTANKRDGTYTLKTLMED